MLNGLPQLPEHTTLAQGNVESLEGGSGRPLTARSKTNQLAEGVVLYLYPTDEEVLLAVRSDEAVIDLAFSVLDLSLDGGSSGYEEGGYGRELVVGPAEMPEILTAGKWESPATLAK